MIKLEEQYKLYRLALQNIENINIFYDNIYGILIDILTILSSMTMSIYTYLYGDLNETSKYAKNSYKESLDKLLLYENSNYKGLNILKYMSITPSVYENNKIKEEGTSYRLYIYINPENMNDIIYTEYDYGYGIFDLKELISIDDSIDQLKKLNEFKLLIDNKLENISNSKEIIKIKKKYFESLKNENKEISNRTVKTLKCINKDRHNISHLINYKLNSNKKKEKRSLQKKIDKYTKKLDGLST